MESISISLQGRHHFQFQPCININEWQTRTRICALITVYHLRLWLVKLNLNLISTAKMAALPKWHLALIPLTHFKPNSFGNQVCFLSQLAFLAFSQNQLIRHGVLRVPVIWKQGKHGGVCASQFCTAVH